MGWDRSIFSGSLGHVQFGFGPYSALLSPGVVGWGWRGRRGVGNGHKPASQGRKTAFLLNWKILEPSWVCLFSHIAPATMGDKYPFNNKNHKKKLATLLPPTPYPVTLMQGLLFDWLCCFRACFSHTGSMQNIDITCVSWHFLRLPKTVPKSPFEAYILKISSVICSVSSR